MRRIVAAISVMASLVLVWAMCSIWRSAGKGRSGAQVGGVSALDALGAVDSLVDGLRRGSGESVRVLGQRIAAQCSFPSEWRGEDVDRVSNAALEAVCGGSLSGYLEGLWMNVLEVTESVTSENIPRLLEPRLLSLTGHPAEVLELVAGIWRREGYVSHGKAVLMALWEVEKLRAVRDGVAIAIVVPCTMIDGWDVQDESSMRRVLRHAAESPDDRIRLQLAIECVRWRVWPNLWLGGREDVVNSMGMPLVWAGGVLCADGEQARVLRNSVEGLMRSGEEWIPLLAQAVRAFDGVVHGEWPDGEAVDAILNGMEQWTDPCYVQCVAMVMAHEVAVAIDRSGGRRPNGGGRFRQVLQLAYGQLGVF